MLAARDELNYRFTVEDPLVYARPWKAEFSIMRSNEALYENACHEGNYALANLLKAGREWIARGDEIRNGQAVRPCAAELLRRSASWIRLAARS